MEYLEYKEFLLPEDLCQWANENAVKTISVTRRGGYYVLFYKNKLD